MRRALWVAALFGPWACAPADDPCSGATLTLSAEALTFGDLWPRDADDPGDVSDDRQVPARRTLLLRNTCGAALHVTEACLIQNTHNGEPGSTAFYLEGPDRATLGAGQSAGLRVTYDGATPNEDLDQDAERDPDRAVLVIQSDAANTPTVVVALCARTVPEGETPAPYDCPAPFTIPPGEALPDLCDR